jgi:nucleoid-associated protein YgaU
MSNKDYDQADGVFDIDVEEDEEQLNDGAEDTPVRPPKRKSGLARETKVGLSVIAVLLVVFIAVLIYRLSSTEDDAIAKRSNEPTVPAKANTTRRTDPRGDQPTVVTPTEHGRAPTNPWAADFSGARQSGSGYGKTTANLSIDSSTNAGNSAKNGAGSSDPFAARQSPKSAADDQSSTNKAQSKALGSAYGNSGDFDREIESSDHAIAGPTVARDTQQEETGPVDTGPDISGKAQANDPFGLTNRSTQPAARVPANDAESQEVTEPDSAGTNAPRFGSNDLLSGSSARWDENQERRTTSTVPESARSEIDEPPPQKNTKSKSGPSKNSNKLSSDQDSSTPLSSERTADSLRFGFAGTKEVSPANDSLAKETEAPPFSGNRTNAFERTATGSPATDTAADDLESAPARLERNTSPGREETYSARPGDTYWKISQRFYGSGAYFKALYEHNRRSLRDPDHLQAEIELNVPDEATLRRLYPELCPAGTRKTTAAGRATRAVATTRAAGATYVVEEGDTLYEIARRQLGKSSRWGEIFELNRDVLGDKLDALSPGTELVLPGDAGRGSATRQTGGFNTDSQ